MTSIVEELLDALDESRERLLVAIEPLDDETLVQSGVIGEWSVADVLTNLTAWESELVTGLMKLDQNKRPTKLLAALADPDAYDRAHFSELQNRDLDQVFGDLQQVRVQVEEWLSEFSDNALSNPRRYRWLEGRMLKDIIAETTFHREARLAPQLEQYAAQVETTEDTGTIIPLSLVLPTAGTSEGSTAEANSDDNTN